MMHDLFTRGIDTATGKIRPSYQASELYKESALGMIPKEWEVKRLEDVVVRKGEYGINALLRAV
jgi:type I restriction enzyme S subunit